MVWSILLNNCGCKARENLALPICSACRKGKYMKSFKHQTEIFERFRSQTYGALFCEMGTGKSRIAITLAEDAFTRKEITACVIITTKGLVGNWLKHELPKHSTIAYSTFTWNLDKKLSFKGPLYFLVNVDGLLANAFPETFKAFLKENPSFMLIIDESTVVKNIKAARTKRCLAIARRAKRRFILSGQPISNSPLDLFSQMEMLTPECLGFKSLVAFRNRYAITERRTFGPRSFDVITGYRHLPELTEKVQQYASIVKKEECLDLPPKIYRNIDVELTGQQLNAYVELRDKALTYIEDHEITAVNAVSLINRLLQICAGQIKVGDAYLSLENNKLGLVRELVDEHAGKTIVWTAYVNTAADLSVALAKDGLWLPSGLALEKRHAILEQFKNDPTKKALIANPASAGHGITLVEATNTIYHSLSYSYENYIQSQDRNHRLGQTNSVLYTHLITMGTLEDKVLSVLQGKGIMAGEVITSKVLREILQ